MTYRKRQAAKRHAKLNAFFTRLTLCLYIFAAGWFFGDATYFDRDGWGAYIPHVGGFHVSTLGDS